MVNKMKNKQPYSGESVATIPYKPYIRYIINKAHSEKLKVHLADDSSRINKEAQV